MYVTWQTHVRHVANTCTPRDKHQFVMLAYTRLPCGKHPHSIQAEGVLSALCNFFVSEMHEGRRVYIPETGYTTRSNSVRYVGVSKNVLGFVF